MKTKKGNGFRFLLGIILLLFLNGCWDSKDINRRIVPLTMGISKAEDGEYKVVFQIPTPQKEAVKSRIVTGKGKTVAEVLGRIQMNLEEDVDYSRIGLVIFQEDLTQQKKEMSKVLEFLKRYWEIPPTVLVAITDDDIQQVLLNINKKLGTKTTSIYNFFKFRPGWAPEISSASVWQFYRSLFSYTQDIAIPIVGVGRDTTLSYEGSAVLNKGVETGRLSPNETLIYNIFKHKNAIGDIETFDLTSVKITNSSIHQKASMINHKPTLSVVLDIGVRVLEKEKVMSDKEVVKKFEKVIENQFNTILAQSRKQSTDLFGFGQLFRNQIPYNQLKDWRKTYYQDLKVNFKVKAYLQNI